MGTRAGAQLMFEGDATAAMELYAEVFADAEILDVERRGEEAGEDAGTVVQARLRIGDLTLRVIDSPVAHDFGFTPAISPWVEFDQAAEVDAAFAALAADGKVLMPLDAYPFSPHFGWVTDRFGVSWQLSVPG